jgi:signal transduction histidine kinase/ActR/RegA family two-component response regulator
VETASRYSRAGQTVSDLMTPDPMVLPSTLGPREAMQTLLADPHGREAFVVVDDGCYVGVSGLRALTSALMTATESSDETDQRIAAAMAEFQSLAWVAESECRGQVHGLLAMTGRLERQHLSVDAQAQVRSIKTSGEALLRLIDDSMDMIRASQGQLELKPRAQLLRELADEVQDRWSRRATESGVGLLISYDGDPDLAAMVDTGRLIQVFDNLIDNALRSTREGSVEVSLRAREQNGQVTVEGRVRDTGPGLAPDTLARIFEPAAGPASQGGALPLSLARGIVLNMKGSIRAESNLGQGMTIVFELMAVMAKAAAPVEVRPNASASPHVLVVDDNATNRMVAEALCEMFGCTCETVQDGVEAVEAARAGRFDMILMDIKMPRMDGIAATRAIRGFSGYAGAVPIVALTANVDADDARGYLAAGMCGVVEKPIKPERLLQAINQALASKPSGETAARIAAA